MDITVPKNEKKYDTIEPAVICTSMYVIYYLTCMQFYDFMFIYFYFKYACCTMTAFC